MCENFDELSDEDDKILDKIWDEIGAEWELEEQGRGKPKWTMKTAKGNRPDLKKEDLKEWMRVANEEYRRLRIKLIDPEEARIKAKKLADRKVPVVPMAPKPKIPKAIKKKA